MLLAPLRRPIGLRAFTKPLTSPATKSFSTAPLRSRFTSASTKAIFRFPSRPALSQSQQLTAKRFFNSQPAVTARPPREEALKKLFYAGAVIGGSLFFTNALFNRETREGGIPLFEREFLKETFTYTGMGVGIIGVAAKALHNSGWSMRLMTMNLWMVIGVGLVGSIGTMFACYNTDPDNYVMKHSLWAGFNLTQAALLAPMFFYSPALIARAGLYTVGVMGSICFVAATAKEDKYLWLGGPLLAGMTVVALSGLAPLVLPVGSRALVGAEAIWLYGGLAVISGITLYDVQKVMKHARMAQAGLIKKDAVNESISLELDFINLFVRILQILGMRDSRRR